LLTENTQQRNADWEYPHPCGYYGDPIKPCTCTPGMIMRYQSKLSGPLIDRIDIHIQVPRVDYDKLMSDERAESSASVRERVERARQRQNERFAERPGIYANADMGVGEVNAFCKLSPEAKELMELTMRRMQLNPRAYHRVLKLSRTIADLDDAARIELPHLAEAIQYRPKSQMS
jgi:magnesium chelatase family protein